jgi:biopolymer transport protein TolR
MAGGAQSGYDDDEGGGAVIGEINVTPLVDIVLVLLIIMMVAAPLIVNNPSIKVELPKAANGDETQKSTISLTLRKDGTLYFNEDPVSEADVATRIKAEFQRNKEVQAIIAGDRGVPYGNVMRLIDLVKSLGVTKFALNIDATP